MGKASVSAPGLDLWRGRPGCLLAFQLPLGLAIAALAPFGAATSAVGEGATYDLPFFALVMVGALAVPCVTFGSADRARTSQQWFVTVALFIALGVAAYGAYAWTNLDWVYREWCADTPGVTGCRPPALQPAKVLMTWTTLAFLQLVICTVLLAVGARRTPSAT